MAIQILHEIYVRTIKDKYVGAVILAAILFLYIFWSATLFPPMKATADARDQMLNNPTMKAFLGDIASTGTYAGFMAMEVFSYMGLVLGAYVAFLTASFAAGEIEQKSCELMLSLPVSRSHVLLSRFAALVPIVAFIVVTMLLATVLGAQYIGESVDVARLGIGMLFMGAFMLAVGGGSLALSALMSNGRNAALVSIGVLMAMFMVENIGSMVTGIDWARTLSLFHYAGISRLVTDPSVAVNWANLGILLVAAIAFFGLAVFAFRSRDIHVA